VIKSKALEDSRDDEDDELSFEKPEVKSFMPEETKVNVPLAVVTEFNS